MSKNGLNYSEKEFSALISNNKVSISKVLIDKTKVKTTKIKLNNEPEKAVKKNTTVDIYKIQKIITNAKFQYTYSESHISILIDDAVLLSVNQIFAFLQKPKMMFAFFVYKKIWHNKIHDILQIISAEMKSKNIKMPLFTEDVELTLFRQAPKLIDMDALTTMFKFIIDGLKYSKENTVGIISEDNPKVVSSIKYYNEKGKNFVGIKIEQTKQEKHIFNPEDILK